VNKGAPAVAAPRAKLQREPDGQDVDGHHRDRHSRGERPRHGLGHRESIVARAPLAWGSLAWTRKCSTFWPPHARCSSNPHSGVRNFFGEWFLALFPTPCAPSLTTAPLFDVITGCGPCWGDAGSGVPQCYFKGWNPSGGSPLDAAPAWLSSSGPY
jgi:hypothetical protein